jgi:type I restriction enzyme R subunit
MYELVSEDEKSALALDKAIRDSAQDGWRVNRFKERRVKRAIAEVVDDAIVDTVTEVAKHHHEY